MADIMFRKYNFYWGAYEKMNSSLFFAQLLDPREKEKGLEFALQCLYEQDLVRVNIVMIQVKRDFKILFEEYKSFHSINEEVASSSSSAVVENSVIAPNGGRLATLQSRKKRHKQNQSTDEATITELDMYLMEVYDESESDGNNTGKSSFDILAWWQANSSRYKILSCMAKDILAMPVSSVASESAFSTGKRVLSPWRSSLSPRTVEALICCQSWLSKPIDLDLLADYVPDDNSKDEEDILGVVQLSEVLDA
ncbi:zinc finger BED domain-containing protein RICESLEEPER 3-like [Papaver somniferum]|uniref:zinc finger BED domain-containing protein RICESLEEPER 3-like n=1 Tax=Papaver somniferum TaxID=3469 RepID=UPI000E6F4791|nr:zinc finger BED domain-containing protein RICESLEEPER 3-like [Papaver somniferum]